jgi:hypothetical protein
MPSQVIDSVVNVRSALKTFYAENKPFVKLWLGYMCVMVAIYILVNTNISFTGWNLYYYFSYTFKVNATPDVNFRSGYPPIGILPYFLLALISSDTKSYAYLSSIMNAVVMSFSMLFMYLSLREVYGKRVAFKSAVLFAGLPSIGLTAFYSNDPIALLMIMIAIYFMVVKRNSALTGIFIGLGTMTKIYPILLAVPAFAFFKTKRDALRLTYSISASIFFVSLPFLVTDPFMYMSVFLHHTLRGPSDTIYALIEGFYGSTGFLHPDFDQFLYHWQVIQIYSPLPNDHAIYKWNNPVLPKALFPLQLVILGLCYTFLRKKNGKNGAIKGAGLTILSYILLSYVFSPQFVVFVIPLMSMSISGLWRKITLCAFMDAATEIQLLVWGSSLLSSFHLPLLIFEIILRTSVILFSIGMIVLQLIEGKRYE